jgi:stress response protein YsnF
MADTKQPNNPDQQPGKPRVETVMLSTEVVPVLQEIAVVGKETVETGKIVIEKKIVEQVFPFEVETTEESVDIARVPAGYYVEVAPPIRQEGDTTIIPILKEEMVMVKKLMLVEEIRITRVRKTEEHQDTVALKEEIITITRTDADGVRHTE